MKIISLTAEHFKRISVVEIVPKGAVVQITGPNGSGKTSVLDAIYAAIGGANCAPAKPIHEGKESAVIRLDLGNIVVTRTFAEGGKTKLTVEAADGAQYPSPQKMLDSLLDGLSFDPLAFTRMAAKDRFQTLRRLVPLDVDVDGLQAQNNVDFETRKEINRRQKEALAAASSVIVPSGLPDDTIDTDKLLRQMETASEHNTTIAKNQAERRREEGRIAQLTEVIDEREERIKRLQQEVLELRTQLAEAYKVVADTPPIAEPIDIGAIRQQIADAKAINDGIERRRTRVEREELAAQLKAEAGDLTNAMDARKATMRESMARANMPIVGLGFDAEDGADILFNGIPFEQASGAEQLRVSMAIAMAANPKLRVLRIKDGSLLDERGMAIVAEMAQQNDYQFWIERVATSVPVGIVMEDGAVREEIA